MYDAASSLIEVKLKFILSSFSSFFLWLLFSSFFLSFPSSSSPLFLKKILPSFVVSSLKSSSVSFPFCLGDFPSLFYPVRKSEGEWG